MQREYVESAFRKALDKLAVPADFTLEFEVPKIKDHGDLSTNAAMKLARVLRKAPAQIADDIINTIELDPDYVQPLTKAGPGFINIKFSDSFYAKALLALADKGDKLGRSDQGAGKTVNVEYVSCNPTGLLHLGHGRNASIGDTVANLYEWLGYEVTREYYFNNAGNQMNILADSIYARYRQQLGEAEFMFPENGYHGEYIKEIAAELIADKSDSLKEDNEENKATIRKYGEQWCFRQIKKTLERMKVDQDVFFNEDSLYSDGKIQEVLDYFRDKGLSYDKDGAVWLALSQMGLEDDRVIVKSSGEPTYRLPDIAYHREKFRRKYDLIVDVFGSDHIATVPDVLAGVKSFGYDTEKVKVLIHQFVTLTENGEQVKMSKRTGKNYTLDDLLDEVGPDVVRFFFVMRGVNTHLEFDLGLAREQSDKNPVFYLQYAHARIASVLRNAIDKGHTIPDKADLSLLVHSAEINLIKKLLRMEGVIASAARRFEPQLLADYLRELAAAFHLFYHECRIITDDKAIQDARLMLAKIARTAVKNGLDILGINAPESM